MTKDGFKILLRIQSMKAIRVTRAYCTDGHDVVLILAGMTTFRNTADVYQ